MEFLSTKNKTIWLTFWQAYHGHKSVPDEPSSWFSHNASWLAIHGHVSGWAHHSNVDVQISAFPDMPPDRHGRISWSFQTGTYPDPKTSTVTLRHNGHESTINLHVSACMHEHRDITPSHIHTHTHTLNDHRLILKRSLYL